MGPIDHVEWITELLVIAGVACAFAIAYLVYHWR